MSASTNQIRILLVGFGNVGRQLARILTLEHNQFPYLQDLQPLFVGVLTSSRGALINDRGVDLTRALYEVESEGRFSLGNPDRYEVDNFDVVASLDYDVLVELSTLNIEERGQPALSYIEAALERRRHCVTANKGPIAFAYSDLNALAELRRCALLFESTVMDGTPVFSLAREGLRGCEILELEGILNSTTNFVLERMENGQSMAEAVEMAEELGFAEADPRYDLDGWDSAVKICLLANTLMGAELTPLDVDREGIAGLSRGDLKRAVEQSRHLKLVCRAWRDYQRVHAEVKVFSVKEQSLFGMTSGSASILRISTDLMGPVTICQEEPTLYDTAYGVLNDLLIVSSFGR